MLRVSDLIENGLSNGIVNPSESQKVKDNVQLSQEGNKLNKNKLGD